MKNSILSRRVKRGKKLEFRRFRHRAARSNLFPKLGLTGGSSMAAVEEQSSLHRASFSSFAYLPLFPFLFLFSQRSHVVVRRERVRERGTDVVAARCLGIIAIGREGRELGTLPRHVSTELLETLHDVADESLLLIAVSGTPPPRPRPTHSPACFTRHGSRSTPSPSFENTCDRKWR